MTDINKGSLKSKIKSAFAWSASGQLFHTFLRVITPLYLIFHIEPAEFGKLGIVMILYTSLNLMGRPAFGQARIVSGDKSHERKEIDDVIFTINMFRSLMVCTVLYASLPFLNRYFENSFDTLVYLLMGTNIISAFRSPRLYLLSKKLDYKKAVFIESFAKLTDNTVALISAVIIKDVAAILIGGIVGSIVRVVLSQYYVPYVYVISFRFKELRGIWSFGLWVTVERMITFFSNNVEKIILGVVLNLETLGIYSLARMPIQMITDFLSAINKGTTFPILSKIKNERGLAPSLIKDLFILKFGIAYVIFLLLTPSISFFVRIFGEKWQAAVLPAILLCAVLILNIIIDLLVFGVFKSIGDAKIVAIQALIKTILAFSLSLVLGKLYGLIGVVIAVIVVQVILFGWTLGYLNRYFPHAVGWRYIPFFLIIISSVLIPAYFPSVSWLFVIGHGIALVLFYHNTQLISRFWKYYG